MEENSTKTSCKIAYIAIMSVLLIIIALSLLKIFVFTTVEVIGQSMYPTLIGAETEGDGKGDVVVINKVKTPQRGDIIIISDPEQDGNDDKWIIKRLIAVEGDTVEIKDGKVILNGQTLYEEYLSEGTVTVASGFNPVTLGADEFFYLGDNRQNSKDSRFYGTCQKSQIRGVVAEWSLNTVGVNRFFHNLTFKRSCGSGV